MSTLLLWPMLLGCTNCGMLMCEWQEGPVDDDAPLWAEHITVDTILADLDGALLGTDQDHEQTDILWSATRDDGIARHHVASEETPACPDSVTFPVTLTLQSGTLELALAGHWVEHPGGGSLHAEVPVGEVAGLPEGPWDTHSAPTVEVAFAAATGWVTVHHDDQSTLLWW